MRMLGSDICSVSWSNHLSTKMSLKIKTQQWSLCILIKENHFNSPIIMTPWLDFKKNQTLFWQLRQQVYCTSYRNLLCALRALHVIQTILEDIWRTRLLHRHMISQLHCLVMISPSHLSGLTIPNKSPWYLFWPWTKLEPRNSTLTKMSFCAPMGLV